MALVPIQIPPGLERNGSPYDTPGRWWDMNLMRWQSGSARPLGGWVRKTPLTGLDSAVRRFHAWRKNSGELSTIAATDGKLWFDLGGITWTDLTPVDLVPPVETLVGGYGLGLYGMGTYGTPRPASELVAPRYGVWSFDNWGEDVLLVSSKDSRLFHYIASSPSTAPIVIPEAPLSNAVGVTEERHVMLVGPAIGGTYYPYRFCWASRESLTDWTFDDPSNSAGFLDLQCKSPLNYICRVREGMLLFSSTEVFLVTYVGQPYIYGAIKIAEMPIFHPYSVATFNNGQAMWFSNRGVQVYSSSAVQTIDCPIFNDIRIDFSFTWGMRRTHASANGNYPEVWLFWPSLSATECDRYAIYNFLEGWWGWGYLSRSAMISSGALTRPYAGTVDGAIYEHENGWKDAGNPILAQRWLETGALGLGGGERTVDVRQAMLATHDRPQSILLQFYGRYTPDGAERVFGPYTPRLDGYTDTRVNCREGRVRYVGNIDELFELGQLRLDVRPGGGR